MTTIKDVKEPGIEGNENLHNAISSFKKFITDYKTEKKSDWELLNKEFRHEMDKIEKTIHKMVAPLKSYKLTHSL